MDNEFNGDAMFCPSTCVCSCPNAELKKTADAVEQNIDTPKSVGPTSVDGNMPTKLNLDLTLVPCARTAIYSLELALKYCKRRSSS